jgi:tetratricopeptide (TPR) repeat protein
MFQSKVLFYKYIVDLQVKSIDDPKIKDEIKNAASICQNLYEKSKLHNIFFDWYMLEIQYCHYNYDYQLAQKMQQELIDYILKQPSLYQFAKIADAYLNLSRTQTFLFRFNDALNSINNSIKFVIRNVEPENFYKEDKSFILLYLKRYDEAIELLQFILSNTAGSHIPSQYSRRKYLLAIALFLKKDYKNCFKQLQETADIENDRDGWNIGVRMLQIYLTLETEKIDLADKRIESLRKHIERTVKMKSVRKRDVVVFRLLSHLSRSGFDFKEVWEERQKDFRLLRSDDPDYRWIPRSHEMILFDQWFESKVKNVPYDPVFPDPAD